MVAQNLVLEDLILEDLVSKDLKDERTSGELCRISWGSATAMVNQS
jgi:hypothetical protein